MTVNEAYEFGKRETTQKYISELTDFNRQLIAQYDIPKTFLDDRALLQTVDQFGLSFMQRDRRILLPCREVQLSYS